MALMSRPAAAAVGVHVSGSRPCLRLDPSHQVFRCAGCGQRFDTESALGRHRNSGRLKLSRACRRAEPGLPEQMDGSGGFLESEPQSRLNDMLADDTDGANGTYMEPDIQVCTTTEQN